MTAVSGSYGAAPVYGTQQPTASGPVTYNPANPSAYGQDQFRTTQKPAGNSLFSSGGKQYVTRGSVMTGLAGAGIGFLIGGPIGALIGGIIGLLVSVLANIFGNSKPAAPTGAIPATYQQPGQQPMYPNTAQSPSAQEEYYRRLQQQQLYAQQQPR